jgi:multiple sugar transport system permease protein
VSQVAQHSPTALELVHRTDRKTGARHKPRLRGGQLGGYLFLLPSAIILLVFVYWPIVQAFALSLQQWQFGSGAHGLVGVSNYARMLIDPRVLNAFRNTLYYTVVTVPAGIVLSLVLALALNEAIPGRASLRGAFFLPVIASFAIIAIVWSFLLDPDIGILSYWLRAIGVPVSGWLRDPRWAMPAVMLVSIWKNVGFNMVIFLAGLQGIDRTYYEAATVDGASKSQRFWSITLPLLRPSMLFVLVISIIAAFEVFDVVWVMTPGGGPLFSTDVVVTYIYHQGIQNLDISYASTIGVALFVIVFVLTLVQLRVLRYREAD